MYLLARCQCTVNCVVSEVSELVMKWPWLQLDFGHIYHMSFLPSILGIYKHMYKHNMCVFIYEPHEPVYHNWSNQPWFNLGVFFSNRVILYNLWLTFYIVRANPVHSDLVYSLMMRCWFVAHGQDSIIVTLLHWIVFFHTWQSKTKKYQERPSWIFQDVVRLGCWWM